MVENRHMRTFYVSLCQWGHSGPSGGSGGGGGGGGGQAQGAELWAGPVEGLELTLASVVK